VCLSEIETDVISLEMKKTHEHLTADSNCTEPCLDEADFCHVMRALNDMHDSPGNGNLAANEALRIVAALRNNNNVSENSIARKEN
jgi:hypothetical protein